ncbi:hypothetical protein ABW20_dc0103418 [Dactylellina cionopaga]|nr:hypothetical protein ABW20_dc0103418 [Dactylellina cionopaga]
MKSGLIPDPFPVSLIPDFLSNLRCLNLCDLAYSPDQHVKYSIWDAFRDHNIHLTQLQVDEYHDPISLLSYLKSYSNKLTKLDLRIAPYRNSYEEADFIAQNQKMLEYMKSLWEDVLGSHSSSLKSLTIIPVQGNARRDWMDTSLFVKEDQWGRKQRNFLPEPWVIGDHMPAARKALHMCQNLEYLELDSVAKNGLHQLIDVVVNMAKVPMVRYAFRIFCEEPSDLDIADCWGVEASMRRQEFEVAKHYMQIDVNSMSWDGDAEDQKWGKLRIEVVPLGEFGFKRDEQGTMWKFDASPVTTCVKGDRVVNIKNEENPGDEVVAPGEFGFNGDKRGIRLKVDPRQTLRRLAGYASKKILRR